jgi:hypothetical protein
MIDAGETNVFEMQVLDTVNGLAAVELAALVRRQQSFQLI